MNEALIKNYNDMIGNDDTVLWLGDCFYKDKDLSQKIMNRLNGHKILILGNHDRSAGAMAELGFDMVLEEAFMNIAGRKCRLKHYPYISGEPPECRKDDKFKDRRPPKIKGEILCHGHNHSKRKVYDNMVHFGVDAWDFKPALYSEVEELISKI